MVYRAGGLLPSEFMTTPTIFKKIRWQQLNVKILRMPPQEWVSKVDHMRSCVPENQEAWKEGSEEHGSSKTAWADSVDSRMASTGIVTQYNKSLASKVYQVTLVRTTPNYLYASIVWKRL
ncbi:hypothetical protein FQA47_015406 [Oryzias melastigma]|uniref:Uncharacterized protein n=1 Tax=Oryzias melastigma TaxID=30732 RepID=A0A834FCS5_ORYME|nr:hypothetical protein FQA47_015406 [Oryzias melastigma]